MLSESPAAAATGTEAISASQQVKLSFTSSDGHQWQDNSPHGLLITFEGGEGTGKTTQAASLANKLHHAGYPVLLSREPGATRLGEHIRGYIKKYGDSSPLAEALLFAAARAELVTKIIRPAVGQGTIVILDRFADSTLAYQGYGRGGDLAVIQTINDIATQGLKPDLTVLLDLDPVNALRRLGAAEQAILSIEESKLKARLDSIDERRFESESLQFHRRVFRGYRNLARKDRQRWAVIKADQRPHRIADAIWKRVRRLLVSRYVGPEVVMRLPEFQLDPRK